MVKLADGDILTREVLDWKGMHLFHFKSSSCSQKTRMVLNLKGADWTSHEIDLPTHQNFHPWYLGINPRGLVPTLVVEGDVHIESNDIITLLDARLPQRKLIPAGMEVRMSELLRHEDELHLDLRTLTFRFTQPRGREPKPRAALDMYKEGGSGTVGGTPDPHKQREISFWERAASEGLTDEAVRASAGRFKTALNDLDTTLESQPYLLGSDLTVLDIAWFVYVNRLMLCGYPLARLHHRVAAWFEKLSLLPELAQEISVPPQIRSAVELNHARQRADGATLVDVAGL